jgi:hypothetical protein
MDKGLTWWQVWGLILLIFAVYGIVGGMECADFDRQVAMVAGVGR